MAVIVYYILEIGITISVWLMGYRPEKISVFFCNLLAASKLYL